ncbi:MAG: ABC transporter ATP-binding protein [Rhodobacteraceae bacterium]|nr:ABC transporter ATP-binding protein [Paracoccaceae bacterium]MYE37172.1 ABC transporter ATP-binding protein [Paracoccaceae bacterium]MYF46316.1 ABC transporter ATP-binding protein [Paracoccaceae bacterium]MYI91303.1 ABC transporter ATP-binding protein [Paracoccaceae bacterium]
MADHQPENEPLVEVRDLKVYFPVLAGVLRRKVGEVKAVDKVSLDIMKGETLGLVGESGCGKTTTGRAILRLNDITDGTVRIKGKYIHKSSLKEIRKIRPTMQMIFQDPQESLNPRMTVSAIISEPLTEHQDLSKKEREERVFDLMDSVGLNRDFATRYPHEFSGGQRQRIGIARALALNPELIVCDEPIAALDVSIQAQVVNLLEDLQEERNLTYLFISHDLGMVRHIATRVAVMYLGQIVEIGKSESLYSSPLHPYTEALLSAVPEADPEIERTRKAIVLSGDVPSPANPPEGCNFCNRCPKAFDICHKVEPTLTEIEPGRFVSCHLYNG